MQYRVIFLIQKEKKELCPDPIEAANRLIDPFSISTQVSI